MTDTGGRSGRARWATRLGWAAVAGLALVVVAMLWVVTTVTGDDPGERADQALAAALADTTERLRVSALDGELTDEEIVSATSAGESYRPVVSRDGGVTAFAVELHGVTSSAFGSAGTDRCYRFTVTGSGSVTAVESDDCR
ncbi:hypothetical protein ACRAKI_36000 [Saccharothrix isguenensis]